MCIKRGFFIQDIQNCEGYSIHYKEDILEKQVFTFRLLIVVHIRYGCSANESEDKPEGMVWIVTLDPTRGTNFSPRRIPVSSRSLKILILSRSALSSARRPMITDHCLPDRSSFLFHRLCDEMANRCASSRIFTISFNTGEALDRGRGFFRMGR